MITHRLKVEVVKINKTMKKLNFNQKLKLYSK